MPKRLARTMPAVAPGESGLTDVVLLAARGKRSVRVGVVVVVVGGSYVVLVGYQRITLTMFPCS